MPDLKIITMRPSENFHAAYVFFGDTDRFLVAGPPAHSTLDALKNLLKACELVAAKVREDENKILLAGASDYHWIGEEAMYYQVRRD